MPETQCRASCPSYDPGVSDFSTRPVTLDDAGALNDLLAAAETVDHTEEHYSVEDVVEELENPMIDLERDWLVVERDGQVVGHSGLLPRAPADGKVRVSIEGAVHPDHRRTGIGSHVVPLMVARAHEYAHERGLEAVVAASAPSANTELEAVFQQERAAARALAVRDGGRPARGGCRLRRARRAGRLHRWPPGRASTRRRCGPRTTAPSSTTTRSPRGGRTCGSNGSPGAATTAPS